MTYYFSQFNHIRDNSQIAPFFVVHYDTFGFFCIVRFNRVKKLKLNFIFIFYFLTISRILTEENNYYGYFSHNCHKYQIIFHIFNTMLIFAKLNILGKISVKISPSLYSTKL